MPDFTYQLPCGKMVQDYIWFRNLNYFEGDALLQLWVMKRTEEKKGPAYDEAEFFYFRATAFISNKLGKTIDLVKSRMEMIYYDALTWKG